jgi:hypothetical protein
VCFIATKVKVLCGEGVANHTELNMYHVQIDLIESGKTVETRYTEIVEGVRGSTTLIPAALQAADTRVEQ